MTGLGLTQSPECWRSHLGSRLQGQPLPLLSSTPPQSYQRGTVTSFTTVPTSMLICNLIRQACHHRVIGLHGESTEK